VTQAKFRHEVIKLNRVKNEGRLCCEHCGTGIEFSEKDIVADHIDNNRKNNDPKGNGQVLCRKHNLIKNPPMLFKIKGEALNCEREWERVREKLKVETLAMEKNRTGKPAFEKWLYSEMLKHNKLGLNDVIDSGSFVSDIGTDTIRTRYLMPMVSRVAYLKILRESVTVNDKEVVVEYVVWRDRERFLKERFDKLFKKYGK